MKFLRFPVLAFALLFAQVSIAADISDFVGHYVGSAVIDNNGTPQKRDMSVVIEETKKGMELTWTSTSYRADGSTKQKEYTIEFVPSNRDNIYASAMKVNVFGKEVPLNPMDGDPYVWGRIVGETFTVFSMLIDEEGGYDMQVYNRTIADGGLNLDYERNRNGVQAKKVQAFLARQ